MVDTLTTPIGVTEMEVLDFSRDRFHYVVWNYTSEEGRYLRYGVGEFTFSATARGGTGVSWTYGFESSAWLPGLFLPRFVRWTYRDFMHAAFHTMQTAAEFEHSRQAISCISGGCRRGTKGRQGA